MQTRHALVAPWLFIGLACAIARGACAGEPAVWLFFDEAHLARSSNVKRTLQQPEKLPKPVLTGNGAWDACPYLFGTVLFDPQEGVYKAWYQSYNSGQPLAVRTPFLYATSRDGRTWTRPELGLFDYRGSKRNNIILQNAGFHDSYSPSVLVDPRDPNPARRYKMIFWDFAGPREYQDSGMMVASSPDGIHWQRAGAEPVLRAAKQERSISDVMDVMFDPARRRFVAYTKGWADPFPAYRLIVRTESEDFLHWSTPEVVLRHAHDATDPQSYGMSVFEYDGVYFGLLRSYKSPGNQTIDLQLTASRDNRTWLRVANQATFLPVGPPGSWDAGMVFGTAPVVRGDVMEFFYGGWDNPHDAPSRNAAIGLATLPRDRFVALSAADESAPARLRTKPLPRIESPWTLNADARGGQIRVGLADALGNEIAGYATADCDPMTTDGLRHRPSWRGQSDLSPLAGQRVSLQIEILGKARLFAVRLGRVAQASEVLQETGRDGEEYVPDLGKLAVFGLEEDRIRGLIRPQAPNARRVRQVEAKEAQIETGEFVSGDRLVGFFDFEAFVFLPHRVDGGLGQAGRIGRAGVD